MLPIAWHVGARLGHVAHGDVEAPLAFEHGADRLAADRQLDHVLHVAHVDAVARHGLPVDLDAQLRLVGLLLDGGVGRAGNGCGSRRASASASPRSVARSGPLMITARSAGEPVTASVTLSMIGCVKLKVGARNLGAAACFENSSTRSALVMPVRPGVVGLQAPRRTRCGSARRGRCRNRCGPICELTSLHLRKLLEDARGCRAATSRRLVERDARRQVGADPDDAFVELRQELGAERRGQPNDASTTAAAAGHHAAGAPQRQRRARRS